MRPKARTQAEPQEPLARVLVTTYPESPDSPSILSAFIKFRGENIWRWLSTCHGQKYFRDMPRQMIQAYAEKGRQWAERYSFGFELGELVAEILEDSAEIVPVQPGLEEAI